MKLVTLAVRFVLLVSLIPLRADEEHQHFTSTEKLGTVSFPTSCSASVQKPFERGVALLHSFWYDEADKQFKQVEESDPKCAMANWGQAMSLYHQLWSRPDAGDLKRGWSLLQKGSRNRHKNATRTRLHRSSQRFLSQVRQSGSREARDGLCTGDGEGLSEIS